MGALAHKQTWWQSSRLRHAGLGKSAPATRACTGKSVLPGVGEGRPVPLAAPKPKASFRALAR